ncbi:MAG TPA: ABC transporter ATP-binding protein [Petrotogaceae bacterium]|nr:ABC transporter ATP-binding protein [Petrotogaceae bacterium]HQF32318.1 ABC transporter ATP-binding protein [Petrotogaceae bacterium]HQH32818.1 ABC transporter ATP-binding protein [Petrotogaceae bacterium]HQI78367.1 ABC transporter ATP-binding protein [Petrotogaceae bacterium]
MSRSQTQDLQMKKPRGFGPRGSLGMPAEKPKNFRKTLRRLIKYLSPYKINLIIIFSMAVLSTVFSILSPKIMGKATTKLFEGFILKVQGVAGAGIDFSYILKILAFLSVLYILSSFFSYVQQYVMAGVAQKTVYKMRKDISEKLARLPLKFYDSHAHGEILSRITNDVDNISNTLQQSITQLISSLVTLIGVIIMMLTISPIMTLITFVTLPLSFIITVAVAKKSQKYFAAQQKSLGQLNAHVEEMFSGHKIIKAYCREEKSLKEFEQINEELYSSGWKAQFISGIIMPLLSFVSNIGYVLICVVGGVLASAKKLEVGDIQAFIQYSRQFNQPITQTANIANILQSTVASAERVFEILDEPEEESDENASDLINNVQGQVEFSNVTFGYSKNSVLIKDMNIRVEKGQTVAIVGPTGAGKTTLVNLLMRFYDISGGKITIDGQDIMSMKRNSVRSIFGMVLQDTWLFSGTIKENIAYSNKNATFEQIVKAAQTAYADHFIRTLPQGYDTLINEQANNISHGQKQLLTIARAVLADPKILILDEATSSVDTRTERLIQKAMIELMKGRTNFVIAHRLSTIQGADLILVMSNGSIIEKGTHIELLEKKGFYAQMYYSQFTNSNSSDQAV